jgi:hypothetical protein
MAASIHRNSSATARSICAATRSSLCVSPTDDAWTILINDFIFVKSKEHSDDAHAPWAIPNGVNRVTGVKAMENR